MIILFLSLAINAGVLATTGYHYYHSTSMAPTAPCPVSPGDTHLYQSLGLSDVQLSKMEPLAHKFHGRLAELGADMEEKKRILIGSPSERKRSWDDRKSAKGDGRHPG